MIKKSICENCSYFKTHNALYCMPYKYDNKGNIIGCKAYNPNKNIIKCIVNFIKGKNENY